MQSTSIIKQALFVGGMILASVVIGLNIGIGASFQVSLIIAIIIGVYAIRYPFLTLLGFSFLIPLEDFLIIGESFTFNRFMGFGLLIAFLLNTNMRNFHKKIYRSRAYFWIIAWLALGVVSLLWSVAPDVSFTRINSQLQLVILTFVIANLVRNVRELNLVLLSLLSGGSILAFVGIVSLTLGLDFVDSGRAIAVQGQSETTFSAILGFGVVIALVFGLYGEHKYRIIYLSLTSLQCVGIVAAAGRGTLVSLIAVVVVLLLFSRQSVPRWFMNLGISVSVIGLSFLLVGEGGLLSEAIWSRFTPEYAIESGFSNRANIWLGHLSFTVPQSPILGYGVGTAYLVHGGNLNAVALAGIGFRDSHSDLVQMLVDLGIVGLLIWLMIYFSAWRDLSRFPVNRVCSELIVPLWVSRLLMVQLFVNGLTGTYIWEKRVFFAIGIAIAAAKLIEFSKRQSD